MRPVPRALALFASACVAACFDPTANVGDSTTEDGDSGDTSSTPGTSGGPGTDGGPGASSDPDDSTTAVDGDTGPEPTSDDDATQTGPDDATESTGEPIPVQCGDGQVAPNEICYDDATLVTASDVTYSARLADVDEDTTLDLVYLIGDQIVIHLGVGDGTFGPAIPDQTLFGTAMEIGDVDGDTHLDAVVVAQFASEIQLFPGSGNASFGALAGAVGTAAEPRVIALADLDGDGDPDGVAGTRDAAGGTVHYLEADAGLASAGAATVGMVQGIAFGEFSGDTDPDVAYTAAGGGNDSVRIRLGNGNLTFGNQIFIEGEGTGLRGLDAGDLDGDDNDDLVYAAHDSDLVGVLLGSGAAGFGDATTVATAAGPNVVRVADVSSDGQLDVLVGHLGSSSVMIFPGDGTGALGEPTTIDIATPVTSIALGDANADGVPDILVTGNGEEIVTLLLSTP